MVTYKVIIIYTKGSFTVQINKANEIITVQFLFNSYEKFLLLKTNYT